VRSALRCSSDFQADFNSLIVPTAASICYTWLLDTLLRGKRHTLVVGQTGTAKSVVVQQKLTRLDSKYLGSGPCPGAEPIMMAFSAQTSANQTQDILDGKFEKRRQGTDKDTGLAYTMWGPMLGKQFCIFIDDFNMPKRETYGAQPPIELMYAATPIGMPEPARSHPSRRQASEPAHSHPSLPRDAPT